MNGRSALGALALGLTIAALTSDGHAAPPVARTGVVETWFDFRFHGQKVGFLHALDEPSDEGKTRRARRRSVFTVRRQSDVLKIESETDATFLANGRPIRFSHSRNEAGTQRVVAGERVDNEMLVRVTMGKNVSQKRLPLADDVYLSSSLDQVFKRDLHEKKRLSGRAIIEEEGELAPFACSVVGSEQASSEKIFVVECELAGIQSKERVRPDGRTVRVSIEKMGAEFVATSREDATKTTDPMDIFGAARIVTKVRLSNRESLETIVLRMRGKTKAAPAPVWDARQTLVRKDNDAIVFRIAKVDPPRGAPKLGTRAPELAAFLKETPYEPIFDATLRQAATKAVGDTKDAWQAVVRLREFVHRHIKKKSLSQAFSTAKEAFERREGDCTEHSILFSTLAKIVGIPARLATGLVYVGGEDGEFGYHAWAEVHVDGRWIPVDPTFGQDIADATHIKFSEGPSDAEGIRQAGIKAAELFGDLELSIESYSPR